MPRETELKRVELHEYERQFLLSVLRGVDRYTAMTVNGMGVEDVRQLEATLIAMGIGHVFSSTEA